jgi:NTE family protein
MRYINLIFIIAVLFGINFTRAQQDTAAPKSIGICLSGGGALGYAHIGALQALEEVGIKPDYISGTSMGSVVGLMYAAGYSPSEILQIIKKEKTYRVATIFKLNVTRFSGYSKHTKLEEVLRKYIPYNNFDSLKIKFSTCCIDFRNNKVLLTNKGEHLKEFTIASASIPLVFENYVIDGVEYVDGGLRNNFPIEPLIDAKCDIIIGVNVINFTPSKCTVSKKNAAFHAYTIIEEEISGEKFKKCDYYIPIKGLNSSKLSPVSFKKYLEIYQIGYNCTKAYIEAHPDIKR